ncbi:uncharacterized protein CELE_C53A3.3 [Caenorhabditis elegans]|uniref:Uncharacterized protein n=1 Tax=Caenorhabditis elegans TaxID=6239 RepID=Q4R129_CAEEL|nr:Uncharacterized protein CELE_C53A3.3 [Caenorhabditis elegans]CCD67856.1 Uncharacterized protein CELE_C53A3.3 [Caenorhabditis elegans]|eukprot:NP_001033470.1 Uncharacterized protein CELE_C53A3.3 [Caenorhabditis elegans]
MVVSAEVIRKDAVFYVAWILSNDDSKSCHEENFWTNLDG